MNNEDVLKIYRLVSTYFNSIIPVFKPIGSNVRFIGSSLYFLINDNKYLLTANHVIENYHEGLVVPYPDNIIKSIPTNRFINIEQENVDLGICKLNEDLEVFTPITLNSADFEYQDYKKYYIALGYPGSKTKVFNQQAKSILDIFYSIEETDDEYKRLSLDKRINIAIRFNQNKVIRNGEYVKTAKPNGMSGGCLLSIDKETLSKIQYEGVLIKWDPYEQKTIIATKKHLVKLMIDNM